MLEEHQGGTRGADRAPQGWVRTYWVFRALTHPLQPLQGFRGPLRWSGPSLSGWAGYPVYPSPYPPSPHTQGCRRRPYPVLGVPETVYGT